MLSVFQKKIYHKSIYITKAWLTFHIQVFVQCGNLSYCTVDVASLVSGSVNDASSVLLVSGVL